ncbi:DUF1080 domain-containing protein [bacterium]|nr:MAG: DUF1080 domain-containing protein [bacterium]
MLPLLLGIAGVLPQPLQTPNRPRDVWAFRSVLDRHPRMLTLALTDKLWVAYDATNCNLYKAWFGGVNFDGPVYTSAHGPQPTSKGAEYVTQDPNGHTWFVDGKPATIKWKGYRLKSNVCTLQYDLIIGGKAYRIEETPEVEGDQKLLRKFKVLSLPAGTKVVLRQALPEGTTAATLSDASMGDGSAVAYVKGGRAGVPEVAGMTGEYALLNFNRATTVTLSSEFPKPPEGRAMRLVSPFPLAAPVRLQESPRTPGVSVRLYEVADPMDRIPDLVGGQTPNASFVALKVDFSRPEDWSGRTGNFLIRVESNLIAPISGAYRFRLTSDDGSRFSIRDEVIVDHDGLHSASGKEGKFTLDKGDHPFRIDYFQGGGDEVLKLEWMKPGDKDWSVVPSENLWTVGSEVKVTSPGPKRIVNGSANIRPGDRAPLAGVHPSFDLATIRPETFRPKVGGFDFLPDGRMIVCNWEPDGGIYLLSGVSGKDPKPAVKRIAFGLAEPLGVKIVGKRIFVLQKQELTELIDLDGDEIIDEYRCVVNGWGVTANFHEFAFGLEEDKGKFYANLAIGIDPGGRSAQPQNPDRGRVIEMHQDGTYRFVAAGLRTPNGIGRGAGGKLYIADNQGDWLPASKIMEMKEGVFYGSHAVDPVGTKNLKEFPPVVWLPQGEIGNSPSQPAPLELGPYKGQMIHGDVTYGGLQRVFTEVVDGQRQGVVFRMTQGLEAGVNRLRPGPDGALYIGGIGDTGNWGQEGKQRYGLQKLTFNGKSTFEPLAIRAKTNGFEIELTEALAPGQGEEAADYDSMSWRYVPTDEYGGPKVDEMREEVRSVTVSPDRKRVFLEMAGVKPGRVVWFRLSPSLISSTGKMLWSTEGWYTLNKIPKGQVVKANPKPTVPLNTLSAQEKTEGFRLLFDGKSLNEWKGWRKDHVGAAWQAANGALSFVPGAGDGGDIRTAETYGDFELRLDWRVAPGGNSGVFYRADEALDPAWATGTEMQVLDDARHPDGRNPVTSAGSNYALYPPVVRVSRAAGEWNRARLVVKGNHVEHWLNGTKVVEYDFDSADWIAKVRESKFKDLPEYGKRKVGYIVLQDHGDPVYYRNIRIRRL